MGFEPRKYEIPDEIDKPVVGHEMGYFVTLPDLAQIGSVQERTAALLALPDS